MEAVVVVALLALVVWVVAGPLRGDAVARDADAQRDARADLEAAKAAKYREIRDAEIDRRTGKLSDADWRAVDRELRAEAIEILHRLDALDPPDAAPGADGTHVDQPRRPVRGDVAAARDPDASVAPAADAPRSRR